MKPFLQLFTFVLFSIFFNYKSNSQSDQENLLIKWAFLNETLSPSYFFLNDITLIKKDGAELKGNIQIDYSKKKTILKYEGRIEKLSFTDIKKIGLNEDFYRIGTNQELRKTLTSSHRIDLYKKLKFYVELIIESTKKVDDPNTGEILTLQSKETFKGKILSITPDQILILTNKNELIKKNHSEISYYYYDDNRIEELALLYFKFYHQLESDFNQIKNNWVNKIKLVDQFEIQKKLGAPNRIVINNSNQKILIWEESKLIEEKNSVFNHLTTSQLSSYSSIYYKSQSFSKLNLQSKGNSNSNFIGNDFGNFYSIGGIKNSDYSSSLLGNLNTSTYSNSISNNSTSLSTNLNSSGYEKAVKYELRKSFQVFVENSKITHVFENGYFTLLPFGSAINFLKSFDEINETVND